jgi:hypothetical protein
MTIDDWQALSIVCGALIGVMTVTALGWGFMRWLWRVGRKLDRMLEEIRSIRPFIRSEINDHQQRWHGQPPPPMPLPTWHVPDPNGSRPSGYIGDRRR